MATVSARLGARIRDLRRARRLSQEQLAERAGVSYKFIGDVERGRGNPTINWLDAVARGLGVSLRDLIVEDADPVVVSYPPLTGRDYSIVRDARDTLEDLLTRYAGPPRRGEASARRKTEARPPRRRR